VFTILGPGETFGEVALLDERATRSASVRAITPGVARYIKREDFYDIREEDPTVDRFLIAVLTAQVRRLSQRAYEASRVSAPQRVRRRLLSLAETFGGHDGVEIEVTHQVLADLAGTSRALANKVVGEETRKRVLDGGYGTIRVLNIAALAERAQPEK
jgi:CRP-like cAMP-binding protein